MSKEKITGEIKQVAHKSRCSSGPWQARLFAQLPASARVLEAAARVRAGAGPDGPGGGQAALPAGSPEPGLPPGPSWMSC